jgi:hypothetical protein
MNASIATQQVFPFALNHLNASTQMREKFPIIMNSPIVVRPRASDVTESGILSAWV